jgi:hypothetical protein
MDMQQDLAQPVPMLVLQRLRNGDLRALPSVSAQVRDTRIYG